MEVRLCPGHCCRGRSQMPQASGVVETDFGIARSSSHAQRYCRVRARCSDLAWKSSRHSHTSLIVAPRLRLTHISGLRVGGVGRAATRTAGCGPPGGATRQSLELPMRWGGEALRQTPGSGVQLRRPERIGTVPTSTCTTEVAPNTDEAGAAAVSDPSGGPQSRGRSACAIPVRQRRKLCGGPREVRGHTPCDQLRYGRPRVRTTR